MENYIYKTDPDNTARYVIGTVGNDPLIVMSINPSIGAPDVDSPTLGTVRHIAKDYGYDSWIILCLYPQRATHTKNLDELPNTEWEDENYLEIADIFKQFPDRKIWAAWGTKIHDRYFFPECLRKINHIAQDYNMSWMHYGPLDEGGDPRYCLYLRDGEGWYPFDMSAYLQKLL